MTDEDSDTCNAAAPDPDGPPCSSSRSSRLLVAEVGEQLVDLEHAHEHVAGLAALERADHPVLGKLVDEARCTGITDAELALQQRRGCAPFGRNRVRRLG